MNDVPRPAGNGFLATVAVSLIVGGVAGGLVGYSVRSLPTPTANTATTKSTLTVREDSETINVVKKADPAVVSIIASKDLSQVYGNNSSSPFDNFFFGWPFQPQQPQGKTETSRGSGFIIRADGWIATNKHVVADDQAEYTVVMNDGKKYVAKVLAADPTNDVAILKIEAKNLPTLPFGDSDGVEIGQTVIAIGNALGQYRNTVTKGVISGKSRTITASGAAGEAETLEDVFQTDASINPGNSGGPLLNLAGQVVGINTAVDREGQLIGFAIPIDVVSKDVTSLEQKGSIVRPYLGVRYILITDTLAAQNKLPVKNGALIQRGENDGDLAVIPGSPADKGGLVENDIITQINGTDINSDHSLAGLLSKYSPGDEVRLTIYHQGEKKTVTVKLEERK